MRLADQVVNTCLRITKSDNVTIFLWPQDIPLAEEIANECFRKGADVLLNLYTDRYFLSYLRELSVESLKEPSVFCKALTENSTVQIWMGAAQDPNVLRRIPPEKLAANSEGERRAHWPLAKEKKVKSLGIGMVYVTEARAKVYGLGYAKWRRMMRSASSIDHKQLARTGKRLKRKLQAARTIQITGPGETDLAFELTERPWHISDGIIDRTDIKEENFDDQIPAGSIYTAPVEESAQGTITFNVPEPYMGYQLGPLRWSFRDGKLVEFKGGPSNRRLKRDWSKASGDKDRIASFTVGFNPKAKTGYTVNHLAAAAITIGIGGNEDLEGKNESSFYAARTIEGATLKADGRTIVKAGKLV